MKSDTERKKYYTEKLHKRKSRMHVHLSKELRTQLKVKKRAVLVRAGDTVRIMRGPEKGREARVASVNVVRRKVFLEGVVAKNARGKENPVPVEPSNLMLIGLESTKERKQIFSDEAFRKREIAKAKAEAQKTAATTPQAAAPAATKTSEARAGAVVGAGGDAAKADAKRNVQANMPQATQKIR